MQDYTGSYHFKNQFGKFNTVIIMELSPKQYTVAIHVRKDDIISVRSTYFEGDDIIPFYQDLTKRGAKKTN